MQRGLASDNNAGIHPDVLAAIAAANQGHVLGYGDDAYTEAAVAAVRRAFGGEAEVFFVWGGTAANVLALAALTGRHHAVICSEHAHLNVDECGASERFLGVKLLDVAAPGGKLTIDVVAPLLGHRGDEHRVQPRVISLTQATELGTVYTPAEIAELAAFAHSENMFLHVDGARLANAAASLDVTLAALTADTGVDVVSLGGTKNGALGGEAVVFLRPDLAAHAKYLRKQTMQLASKMRFVAVQFQALLTGDLWRHLAAHANAMAALLADLVRDVPGVRVTQPVQANAVFATVPAARLAPLQAHTYFYVWDAACSEVRWMTSWDTSEDDVRSFAAAVGQAGSEQVG